MSKEIEIRLGDLYASVSFGGGGGGGDWRTGRGSRTERRGRQIGATVGGTVGGAVGGRFGLRKYGAAAGTIVGGAIGARIGQGMSDPRGTVYAPAGPKIQNYRDRGTRPGYPQ